MDSKKLMVMKPTPKTPLLLKDYLLDDLSSCSSSGFRAYPRRKCCTTVRFLLEIDMKSKQAMYKKKLIKNNNETINSPILSTTLSSALQKASGAVINAVKRFSFTVIIKSIRTSSSRQNTKIPAFPRSLSRKLLREAFWKKNDRRIIKSDGDEPFNYSSQMDSDSNFTSEINSKKSDHRWSMLDSDYAISTLDDSNVVSSSRSSKRVGVTTPVGDDCDATTRTNSRSTTNYSTNNSKKSLTTEEEKEQCSPVSVLDCPFDDEDEPSSSFRCGFLHVKGTKEKPMKKLYRFDQLLSHVEPLNLENRLGLPESDHHQSVESGLESFMLDTDEENEKPLKLLELIKATMPSSSCSSKLKADNLLLDFFKERITYGDCAVGGVELLRAAEDWINGKNCEISVEWEVQKNRVAFIEDMEKRGEWKTLDEGKKQVAYELEAEVFASLLNELLRDLLPSLVIV